MNGWAEQGFVAVDWGSTARRAYALDAQGRVIDEMEDAAGTLATPKDRFPAEVAALRTRFGGATLLMAGMVGSNRGWVEAPYVACPATLDDLAGHLLWVEPGHTAIVPGLSLIDRDRADVMRGEEVQMFGLAALDRSVLDAIVCHPGTHTKWIETDGRALTHFRTVMTGELFGLLKRHSILAELMLGDATPGPAFEQGVGRGLGGAAVSAELFSVRAGVLLGQADAADASSFVSGLLIGADLRAGLAGTDPGREIVVLGRGSLTRLYAVAIRAGGRQAREVDGAQAFVAGMHALAEKIT